MRQEASSSAAHVLPGITAALFCLSLTACSNAPVSESNAPPLTVGDELTLVTQDEGAEPNDHPVQLDEDNVFAALQLLRMEVPTRSVVPGAPKTAELPVFTTEKLERAVPRLVALLAEASPQQDVALRLRQLRRTNALGFLNPTNVTAARVFHRDGALHLLFGTVEENRDLQRDRPGTLSPKAPGDAQLYREMERSLEIGSRQHAGTLPWTPLLPEGTRLQDSQRNDWLIVELDEARATAARQAAREAAEAAAIAEAVAKARAQLRAQEAAAEAATEAAAEAATTPAPAQDTAAPTTTSQPPSPPRSAGESSSAAAATATPRNRAAPADTESQQTVEARLRQLRHLRDEGLISEALYEEKVREVLDRLLSTP